MGGSGSKSKGFWPFAGSGTGNDPTNEGTNSRWRGSEVPEVVHRSCLQEGALFTMTKMATWRTSSMRRQL
uniref:Uncharacterized protein n=1 Tax=Anguilla anguilla TaxID=7936 RepID=A0A0E9S814_ANGAN